MGVIEKAREAQEMFELKNFDDGQSLLGLKRDRPNWVINLCQAAHGKMGPDEFRFRTIKESLELIIECDGDAVEAIAKFRTERRSPLLLKWLNSDLSRITWVEQAVDSDFVDQNPNGFDLLATIAAGQVMEKREVFGLVHTFLTDLDSTKASCILLKKDKLNEKQ